MCKYGKLANGEQELAIGRVIKMVAKIYLFCRLCMYLGIYPWVYEEKILDQH
jgi:hypothetical protein